MTQGNRVKIIRQSLNLTLEKFGAKLGVQKSAINKIEKGDNKLTEQMSKLICREFNVNYDWLIHGEGEMFLETDDDIIQAVGDIMSGENEFHKNLIKSFAHMSLDDLKALERVIDLCSSLKQEPDLH